MFFYYQPFYINCFDLSTASRHIKAFKANLHFCIDINIKTYLNLCTQFYDLSKPSPPQDAYDFYKTFAKEANGLILESMCGTGRFLLPLLQEGFEVDGFDSSQYMLNALHRKAKEQGVIANIWREFAHNLHVDKK